MVLSSVERFDPDTNEWVNMEVFIYVCMYACMYIAYMPVGIFIHIYEI